MGDIRSGVLQGPTVTLRPLAAGDAVALAAAASESRQPFAYTRVPDAIDDAHRYIEAALADREAGRRLPFAILWHDRVVGSTSYLDLQRWRWPAGSALQRTDVPDAVEIGSTWLAASAQRTRCNTEAKHLLLSHAFDVWGVHRVSLRTDERNAQSRRAINGSEPCSKACAAPICRGRMVPSGPRPTTPSSAPSGPRCVRSSRTRLVDRRRMGRQCPHGVDRRGHEPRDP